MSDYISKEVTMQRFVKEIEQSRRDCIHINTIKRLLDDIDTLDEKEIIRKAFERVVEQLTESKEHYRRLWNKNQDDEDYGALSAYEDAIATVKEEGGIE